MIDVEKFVFKNEVESNPLIRIQLTAMKYFGYMLFEHQRVKRLHCFRGVVFTVSFILFNITQVRGYQSKCREIFAFITINLKKILLFLPNSRVRLKSFTQHSLCVCFSCHWCLQLYLVCLFLCIDVCIHTCMFFSLHKNSDGWFLNFILFLKF